ncbi:Xylogalacturonan beta-1,3-xylosyltransferase [Bertholletia excelsa]
MREKSVLSWRLSSLATPSSKLVWLVVTLVFASGLIALGASNWVSSSGNNFWVWSSSNFSPDERFQSMDSKVVVGNQGDRAIFDASPDDLSSSPAPAPAPAPAPSPSPSPTPSAVEETILEIAGTNTSGVKNIISRNESGSFPMRLERKHGKLQKLEAGLAQARAAIREARKNGNQTEDPDYLPTGPMYWNANAFHRSYLEMEKQFKVFVYEDGEPPIFHNGPCKSIYAMEGNFIYHMEVTQFRTTDPDNAHVFFLPFSVAAIVTFIYEPNSHNWAPMKRTVRDYVNLIAGKYQYWNRSLGADHVMLSCHDWGPELSSSAPHLRKNSIRALCNANTSEGFNPAKDVSFPEIFLADGTMRHLLGGPSPSKRPILAFFAGGVHGPVRPILLEHWENKDEDVQVHRYLPKGVSYYEMLRKSRFCICPSGYEVASPRIVEALYTGCVPVLINDHYVAPFSDVLNWKRFSVEIPVKDIPNLKKILMGISQRQYIRLQRRGRQMRRHFEVNLPPKRFDVFHMVLHSIWLRRLNVRLNPQP